MELSYINTTVIFYDYITRTEQPGVGVQRDVTKVVLLGLLGILTVFGNIFVCISSYIHKKKYSEVDYPDLKPAWVAVAVANVLLGLFMLIKDAAWQHTVQWNAGNAGCKIFRYLGLMSFYATSFTTVFLAVSVIRKCSPKWIRAIPWVGAVVFALPEVSKRRYFVLNSKIIHPIALYFI